MYLLGNKSPLVERLADKKARVTEIALECASLRIKIQTKIGFCRVDADVRHHAFLEIRKCVFVVAIASMWREFRKTISLFMARQLLGDCIKRPFYLCSRTPAVLVYVFSIEFEYFTLYSICSTQIVGRHERRHCLRHPAHRHVFAKGIHRLTMQKAPQGLHALKMVSYHRHSSLVAFCP